MCCVALRCSALQESCRRGDEQRTTQREREATPHPWPARQTKSAQQRYLQTPTMTAREYQMETLPLVNSAQSCRIHVLYRWRAFGYGHSFACDAVVSELGQLKYTVSGTYESV